MLFFHGTTMAGLTELRGEPIYLTDNRAYSLFYIREREIDYVTCGVTKEGKVFYEEWFPHQLRVMYDGMAGYVYHVCPGQADRGRANGIYLSSGTIGVREAEFIENVYHEIQRQIQSGQVIVKAFEAHTHREIQEYYQRFTEYLGERKGKMSQTERNFFRQHFPGCMGSG